MAVLEDCYSLVWQYESHRESVEHPSDERHREEHLSYSIALRHRRHKWHCWCSVAWRYRARVQQEWTLVCVFELFENLEHWSGSPLGWFESIRKYLREIQKEKCRETEEERTVRLSRRRLIDDTSNRVRCIRADQCGIQREARVTSRCRSVTAIAVRDQLTHLEIFSFGKQNLFLLFFHWAADRNKSLYNNIDTTNRWREKNSNEINDEDDDNAKVNDDRCRLAKWTALDTKIIYHSFRKEKDTHVCAHRRYLFLSSMVTVRLPFSLSLSPSLLVLPVRSIQNRIQYGLVEWLILV